MASVCQHAVGDVLRGQPTRCALFPPFMAVKAAPSGPQYSWPHAPQMLTYDPSHPPTTTPLTVLIVLHSSPLSRVRQMQIQTHRCCAAMSPAGMLLNGVCTLRVFCAPITPYTRPHASCACPDAPLMRDAPALHPACAHSSTRARSFQVCSVVALCITRACCRNACLHRAACGRARRPPRLLASYTSSQNCGRVTPGP